MKSSTWHEACAKFSWVALTLQTKGENLKVTDDERRNK